MTFNQVVRGSNPRTLTFVKECRLLSLRVCAIFFVLKGTLSSISADVAELADALDLGSSVYDVQVQVLSSAFNKKY